MKLKLLLMPTAVIISIVLTIWHIWPRIFDENLDNSITSLRKDMLEEQKEYSEFVDKKNNIAILSSQMQENDDIRQLVLNYYPVAEETENIVNKLNQVAVSSGVYISDMDVKESDGAGYEESSPEDALKVLRIKKGMVNSNNNASKLGTIHNDVEMGIKQKDKDQDSLKIISAKLDILGNYNQIKSFLASLYSIGFINNIESFGINVFESTNQSENANIGEEENVAPSEMLEAVIVVNFGYRPIGEGNLVDILSDSVFSSGKINLETIKQKRSMLTEKYPKATFDERGSSNPFFPGN